MRIGKLARLLNSHRRQRRRLKAQQLALDDALRVLRSAHQELRNNYAQIDGMQRLLGHIHRTTLERDRSQSALDVIAKVTEFWAKDLLVQQAQAFIDEGTP